MHILVGTPGHVFGMIERRALDVRTVKLFILDEADEMLKVADLNGDGLIDYEDFASKIMMPQ